jgi:hypothetical protein
MYKGERLSAHVVTTSFVSIRPDFTGSMEGS